MKYDAKGQPVPELAESFTYDKGAHTYAFKLRDGVKWHDGKPLTVEDILFTYEALTKDKTLASSITSNYEDIKSITAPDAQTVVFTLSKPNAAMLDNFTIGILPNILNTVYLVGVTLIITLPLGVGAAIYLTEYARNRRLVAAIEFATETLTGIPSIIFGLVGMLLFVQRLGLKAGILAGGLTLVVMILPTIVRTTQESLKTVPQSYREGALGLGAGKWRMVRTVVLPNAIDAPGSATPGTPASETTPAERPSTSGFTSSSTSRPATVCSFSSRNSSVSIGRAMPAFDRKRRAERVFSTMK